MALFANLRYFVAMKHVFAFVLAMAALIPLGHAADAPMRPSLGDRVLIFNPRMSTAEIQRLADEVAKRQADNQFGEERDALLFEPGSYGSKSEPLRIQMGYYTSVSGLGASPKDVVIHGVVQVRNRCFKPDACLALDNFWRSLSNLTIEVTPVGLGCGSDEIFAVSQAAPVRRLRVMGGTFKLADTCTPPSFASGGFIADSELGEIDNGGQQQFFVRNSRMTRWVRGNWNQVFAGVQGELPTCPASQPNCPYFSLPRTEVTREAPYLYRDRRGNIQVFRPAVRHDGNGPSWAEGREPGVSVPLATIFIASPADSAARINAALAAGKNLLLTPGVYRLDEAIRVQRAGTTVLGLGFPTLIPTRGNLALQVSADHGVSLSQLLIESGQVQSAELVRIGESHSGDAQDPTTLSDVFFRVGGPAVGNAKVSLVVNSSHVIIDHVWAWRADHGSTGWTQNLADTGLIVNGDEVTALGLFVEHYQKDEVVWNGEGGTIVFLQNEMPYDPPDQAAWRSDGHDGFPALKVAANVKRFRGYGFGSYTYFNQGVQVFAERAYEVPVGLEPGSLQDVFTIFLNAKAWGGIRHVVNDTGGISDVKNPDIAIRVSRYP